MKRRRGRGGTVHGAPDGIVELGMYWFEIGGDATSAGTRFFLISPSITRTPKVKLWSIAISVSENSVLIYYPLCFSAASTTVDFSSLFTCQSSQQVGARTLELLSINRQAMDWEREPHKGHHHSWKREDKLEPAAICVTVSIDGMYMYHVWRAIWTKRSCPTKLPRSQEPATVWSSRKLFGGLYIHMLARTMRLWDIHVSQPVIVCVSCCKICKMTRNVSLRCMLLIWAAAHSENVMGT